MRKILLFVLAFIIIIPYVQGQDRTVTGIIVSGDDRPVSKIKLTIDDLPYGGVTKKDGTFKIDKLQPEDTIIVQLNNKKYAKFLLRDCSTLKLILSNDIVTVYRDGIAMENVMAQKKVYGSNNSNSTIITAKMIDRLRPRSVYDAIRMKSPGFNSMPISFNSPKIPLVYLDGIETSFDIVNSLPIESIETIEINKHGDGYGARGAAGVILVTQKKMEVSPIIPLWKSPPHPQVL